MARGGMGELFLAAAGETGGFEKLCVVKKVLTELEDDGVRRRFLDEAKVVVRLNHANLVQVFDAGRVTEDHYLAMELVEGKDLRAVWNRCAQLHRRIPVDFAIFVVRELCRGLDYVHDAMSLDLVHRDISPPNIMVSYHGQIKITDFGLATHAIKSELTNPGVVFGRYSYLSPEQARGFPADRRTDIYAAGIVLWEMLTGRQLFPADRQQSAGPTALAELRNPKIQAPSAIVPGIPDGLDEAVLRALAVEREDRFQTAGEFKVALSDVLNRHHPSSDVDQVATFMRDIFAREYKLESQDYAIYAREDFSPIRAQANIEETDTLSISDAIELGFRRGSAERSQTERNKRDQSRAASGEIEGRLNPPQDGGSTSIALDDGDIVELQSNDGRGSWTAPPDTEELTEAALARVGSVVGKRYRVDRLLGVGGMGAVFAATHLALGKTYALKILHEVYGRDPDIIDRFMREARAATQTGHPNIIDVVDIGTISDGDPSASRSGNSQGGGDLYFVMELLEGTDLGTVIRQSGPLAIRRAVHIGRQICRALSAAHEAGIIHRDLKSENVVLTIKSGDPDFVKVLDFGICKQIDTASSSQTTPGMVMGSPDYMAPEQAAGAAADAKSDIYALGTILFEMLTGGLPFTGRNAIDVLMKKGGGPAPSVVALRPDVPAPLVEVISRCLDRELEDRPESMKALEYELTRAIEGRASAVAAVMGLQLDPEATASASGSAPNPVMEAEGEASSAADSASRAGGGRGKSAEPIVTVHDQAAARSLVSQAIDHEGRRKPWLWLGLGAAGVLAIVVMVRPELIPGLGPRDGIVSADGSVSKAGLAGTGPSEAADRGTAGTGESEGLAETAGTAETGEGTAEGSTETGGAASPEAIVGRGEKALGDQHWREPAAGSLAIELANLGIADPGHEAIARLRREAEKILEPLARKAAKDKDWASAVEAYRDLLAVWPDHESARSNFVDALRSLGRKQRSADEYEGLLATADELLNLEPKMFVALKYRADALAGLERWDEAAPAYRAAMRIRPSNRDAKRGYYRARRQLKDRQR